MMEMAFLDHEQMRILVLDTKNRVVDNISRYQRTVAVVLNIAILPMRYPQNEENTFTCRQIASFYYPLISEALESFRNFEQLMY
jgi:hypothetical protein